MPTVYAALDGLVVTAAGVPDDPQAVSRLTGHEFECFAAAGETAFAGTVDSGLLRSPDRGVTWEPVGGVDERVTAVTIGPRGTVWAGTEPSAVYRSSDGRRFERCGGLADLPSADRWSFPPRPHTHHVRWLTVDPHDPDRAVVSAAHGARSAHTPARAEAYVYRRTGAEWTRATDGLPDPEGTARAILAAGAPGEFYALTNRGLFHTGDGARSWAEVEIDLPGTDESQVGRGLAVTGVPD